MGQWQSCSLPYSAHPDAASHWSCSSLVAKARLGDGDQEKHINKLKAVAHKSGKVWELVDVLMETDAMAESDGMLLRPVSHATITQTQQ